ncbi:Dihydroneopterin triphosphate diphosphatase [Pseudoalteromonas holothuriae]|uniref:Dihydroneopterin triphosphate diphosphatase n=1 Tax=Pseudoalteromonas holothuriae TaxID=2963714 RepID=A0A9W4QTC9_9GAMM|nr:MULTISPECIES: dihydroneopterin triphosphate diphosphatase [unclassified Pseudoalteromonas]CAH9050344.1 Dihydroneopterin triphosphate diphosphatase [Pseudoalteromonas sp. CIP111951]CAH9052336.1 Dihydroneopterin triphosphate diphosphatase [Pseudoalteromonas sp. CIP111854]
MQLRKPISVLVIIYNYAHQFLLIKRTDDANFWQSVTGGVEQNESLLETAYRELKEETGIDAHALGIKIKDHKSINQYEIRPCWRHRYIEGANMNTEHVFSICVPNDIKITLNPHEHTHYEWLTQKAAVLRAWSPSNQKEIRSIKSNSQ